MHTSEAVPSSPSQDFPCSQTCRDEANTSSAIHEPTQMGLGRDSTTNVESDRAISDDITMETSTEAQIESVAHMSPIRVLPSFQPVSCPTCTWVNLSGHEFSSAIDGAYSEIVHWRPNLFKVSSGASANALSAN